MKVGQTVYLKPIEGSNAYRMNPYVIESTIEKVGRKYVTLTNGDKFHIENGRQVTEYLENYELFDSLEAVQERVELVSLANRVDSYFRRYSSKSMGLDKCRKIYEMINS